jgi:lysophospholipase L1-like esterase
MALMSEIRRMVALGSSFAAGPGIQPVADRRAGRSKRNYAHLLADTLSAELTDATVSGATTANILDTPQRTARHTFAPQIDLVARDADLVTITAGGNDVDYLGGLIALAFSAWLDQHWFSRPLAARFRQPSAPDVSPGRIESATSGLARIVDEVRLRAPGARILLVDYLTIVDADARQSSALPFDGSARARFRDVADKLAGAFAEASRRSGAELVEVSSISAGHGVDSAEPWVRGFHAGISLRSLTPFHPNEVGMQHVANAILEHLESRPA